jgi:rhodanese-related sulfurtransferase
VNFVIDNIFLIAVAFLSGGMLLWPVVNKGMAGAMVGTLQATRLMNDRGAVVLDVRPPADFATGHLPNARNIPDDEVVRRAGELPSGKPVIVCASGNRAGKAAAALRAAGRQEVFCLEGGVEGWLQAGLPLVKR